MFLGVDTKTGTFQFEHTVKNKDGDRTAVFSVDPRAKGVECLSLDLKAMLDRKLSFHAGHLASFHHSFTLDDFTNKAMSSGKIMGPYSLLNKFVNLEVIQASDIPKIVQGLKLEDEIKKEIGF